jgi:hypothetical protein
MRGAGSRSTESNNKSNVRYGSSPDRRTSWRYGSQKKENVMAAVPQAVIERFWEALKYRYGPGIGAEMRLKELIDAIKTQDFSEFGGDEDETPAPEVCKGCKDKMVRRTSIFPKHSADIGSALGSFTSAMNRFWDVYGRLAKELAETATPPEPEKRKPKSTKGKKKAAGKGKKPRH